MKIKKIKNLDGKICLNEQANSLANAELTTDSILEVFNNLGYKKKMAWLEAENVQPMTSPELVAPGELPMVTYINRFAADALIDILALYGISGSLGKSLLDSHNIIVQKEQSLLEALRVLRGKIATLKLYGSGLGDRNSYKYFSFNSMSELGALDGEAPQASLSVVEGMITLPMLSGSGKSLPIERMEIEEGSIGYLENGAASANLGSNIIQILTDGEEHTWINFTSREAEPTPARLVLKTTLKARPIINQIVIRPANIGTIKWVAIEDILISRDGLEPPTSIRNEILSPAWSKDNDPFKLSPANTEDPSIGMFTFTPRKAKVVHIILSQDEHTVGTTEDGEITEFNCAIPLREVAISQVKFGPTAGFQLAQIDFTRSIRSVGLLHNVTSYNERIAEITYSLSADNGETWSKIKTLDEGTNETPESAVFQEPIRSLRIKGEIKRIPEGFQNFIGGLAQVSIIEELIESPDFSKGFSLKGPPVSHTEVILTGLGSVGFKVPPTLVGIGKRTVSDRTVYNLPYTFPGGRAQGDLPDSPRLRVLVNGEEWQLTGAFTDNTAAKVIYDEAEGAPRLIFGDGSLPAGGRIAPVGGRIEIFTSPEHPSILPSEGGTGGEYIIETVHPIVKTKDLVSLEWMPHVVPVTNRMEWDNWNFDPPEDQSRTEQLVLGANKTVIDLQKERLYISIYIKLPNGDPWTEVYFANGNEEFIEARENAGGAGNFFSHDWEDSKLFLDPDAEFEGSTLELNYIPIHKITDYEFVPGRNAIRITDTSYKPVTIEVKYNTIEQWSLQFGGLAHIHLPYRLAQGSLAFSHPDGVLAQKLSIEIPFQNGANEFAGLADGILGKVYSIDYESMDSMGSPETVIYRPPAHRIIDNIVFPGGEGDTKIIFQSVDLQISYQVGETLIENIDYSVTSKTSEEPKIEILPSYILKNENRGEFAGKLLIRYDLAGTTENKSELVEFYSPVLRDLALTGVTVDPRLASLENL